MRYFLIYVILMIAIALTLGCGTENPVCTSSFCVIPRDAVDGEVIEIDEDKALAFIQTLAVDTPEATPVETPENSEVSLMDIITDAAAGGSAYVGQTLTLEATVVWRSKNREAIIIYTTNDFEAAIEEGAGFFIFSLGNPVPLNQYVIGTAYEFTVTISEVQAPDKTLNIYKIVSTLTP